MYATLCIAICDARRRFLHFDITKTATTHDCLAFVTSQLGVKLEAGALPPQYFIAGDSAFVASQYMVTPTNGEDTNFDFVQSSNRMAIECSFGILVRRWGIFWRPLACSFNRRGQLIGACMRLHNFCINHNQEGAEEFVVTTRSGRQVAFMPGVRSVIDRWADVPVYDKSGAQVPIMREQDHEFSRTAAQDCEGELRIVVRDINAARCSPKHAKAQMNRLRQAVADAGIVRPPLPGGIVARKKSRSALAPATLANRLLLH